MVVPRYIGRVSLRHSPLHDEHLALGAKLVDFGGFEMPLSYPAGTIAEHLACRQAACVFDVSHLGTVRMVGPEAFTTLQRGLSNDLRKIAPGRAQYSHLLNDRGGVVDDVIVWWVSQERFDVMPNASNTARVRERLGGDDVTPDRAVLAVQGPAAREIVRAVSPDAASTPRYSVATFEFEGEPCVVAGTGYTGEDGVECAVPSEIAPAFFDALLAGGAQPAGLGARDTLRLEAGLPLHGHELSPDITPLEAGLEWVIGWGKDDFVGREALLALKQRPPARRLVGLLTDDRRPPRAGAAILEEGVVTGSVTSGNYSPVLKRGIALGFVASSTENEAPLEIDLRGARLPARIVSPPFYRLAA